MLTFAIGAHPADYPETCENVGFFAQPGPEGARTA